MNTRLVEGEKDRRLLASGDNSLVAIGGTLRGPAQGLVANHRGDPGKLARADTAVHLPVPTGPCPWLRKPRVSSSRATDAARARNKVIIRGSAITAPLIDF